MKREAKALEKKKKVFLISPVRNADPAVKALVEAYVTDLETHGHTVHWPARDTKQNDPTGGWNICVTNFTKMFEADEVHVWYEKTSAGSLFDMGGLFMLVELMKMKKPIVIANEVDVEDKEPKSFFKVLKRLAKAAQEKTTLQ